MGICRIKAYIEHISESFNLIEKYANDLTFEDFSKNPQIQDAVIRRILVIGEAVKKISMEIRDVMVHDYDEIHIETL